jgi:FkbM family methyltransferase
LLNKRSWGPFTEAYETTKFDHAFSVSWSQAAEDLAIMPLLGRISNGKYIDIGAHHPSLFSVTRHLFQNGWSGVNVDANTQLIAIFDRERPNDKNLNACVGSKSEYKINIFDEPAISTISAEWTKRFESENNKVVDSRAVRGITLRSIFDLNFPSQSPDFLNIDIEGADFEALVSGDFASLEEFRKPKWVLLEALAPVSKSVATESVNYLIEQGYEQYLVLPYSTLLKLTSYRIPK